MFVEWFRIHFEVHCKWLFIQKREALSVKSNIVRFGDGLTDRKKSARSFLSFIDFVIMPLVTQILRHYPTIEEAKAQLEKNRIATAERVAGGG